MSYIPLKDALVKILQDSNVIASKLTGADGRATFILPKGTYTLNVEKEGYQPYSEIITLDRDLIKEVYLSKLPPYPSGFDPNDSRWMPEGGWDELCQFDNPGDVSVCTDKAYAEVSNGLLIFNPPMNEIGYCYRYEVLLTSRIAIAMRINRIIGSSRIVHLDVADISDCRISNVVNLYINDDGDIDLSISGSANGSVTIPYNGEWFVLLYNNEERNACIYLPSQEEPTCIFEGSGSKSMPTKLDLKKRIITPQRIIVYCYYAYSIAEPNYPELTGSPPYNGVFDVEVDWIAVKGAEE